MSLGNHAVLQVRHLDTVLDYRYVTWKLCWPTGMSLRNHTGLQVYHTWKPYWPTGMSRGHRAGLQVEELDNVLIYSYSTCTTCWPTGTPSRHPAGLQVHQVDTVLAYSTVFNYD